MLSYKDSDLFQFFINKNNVLLNKYTAVIRGTAGAVILNDQRELITEIKRKIIDRRKDMMMAKLFNGITSNQIIMVYLPPEFQISDCMPFIVCKVQGKPMAFVNMTNIVNQVREDGEVLYYELGENVNKVDTVLYAAALALYQFDPSTTLSSDCLYYSSIVWAEMFCKPIFSVIDASNSDRKLAFIYFAIRFFLTYYMQCPEAQVNDLSGKYINNKKNILINHMEEQIRLKGLDIYAGLIPFLQMLFNSEVTLVKGNVVKTLNGNMTVVEYLNRFISTYHNNAVLSLCGYPYFIYTMLSAVKKAGMVKDKSFERLIKDNNVIVDKMLVTMLK